MARNALISILITVAILAAGCVADPSASGSEIQTSQVKNSDSAVTQISSPTWEVGAPVLSAKQIGVGQEVIATWTIKNTGTGVGEKTFSFKVGDTRISEKLVLLNISESIQLVFSYKAETPGTHLLKLDGYPATALVVILPAALQVDKLSLSKSRLMIGDDLLATVDVSNTGGAPGFLSVDVLANGNVVGRVDFNLNGGQSGTQSVKVPTETRGVMTVVAANRVEEVTVLAPAAFEFTTTDVSESTVATGSRVEVGSSVRNTGDVVGEVATDLLVNGATVQSQRLTVEPSETKVAKFEWIPSERGVYTLAVGKGAPVTVTVKMPAKFDFMDAAVSARETIIGAPVTYHVRVANSGEMSGTFEVVFKVDGSPRQTVAHTIAPGASVSADFPFQGSASGIYVLSVNELPGIQVKVLKPASFVFDVPVVSPASASTGDTVTVTVNVRNVGEVAGQAEGALFIGGAKVTTKSVGVQPNSASTITFSYVANSPGQLSVQVADSGVATLTVHAPSLTNSYATYQDLWCNDKVPIRVTVVNNGQGTAKQVRVIARSFSNGYGGSTMDERTIGSIPNGESVSVDLVLKFNDRCGSTDNYSAEILIEPANGGGMSFNRSISI